MNYTFTNTLIGDPLIPYNISFIPPTTTTGTINYTLSYPGHPKEFSPGTISSSEVRFTDSKNESKSIDLNHAKVSLLMDMLHEHLKSKVIEVENDFRDLKRLLSQPSTKLQEISLDTFINIQKRIDKLETDFKVIDIGKEPQLSQLKKEIAAMKTHFENRTKDIQELEQL